MDLGVVSLYHVFHSVLTADIYLEQVLTAVGFTILESESTVALQKILWPLHMIYYFVMLKLKSLIFCDKLFDTGTYTN